MEAKKTRKADLEGKKSIFFEIGLLLALGLVLYAFEWRTSTNEVSDFIIDVPEIIDEVIIPVTVMRPQATPPPPPPKMRDIIEVIEEEEFWDEDALDLTNEVINTGQNDANSESNGLNLGDYEVEDTGEILEFVPSEDMPSFPGNVQKWLSKNIKYPSIAIDNGITGKVLVQFVVEKDGSISNINIVRNVDPLLDKEAARVIGAMPKWNPGKQRGKAVRVRYTIPINFYLDH